MGISGRIAKHFLHSSMTPLLALVAVLLGTFAVLVTPREEEPQINVTMANVMISYPGASAKDVAQTVATPAEQVLSQIAGVDHVYSVAQPGMAVITVQFKVGQEHVASLVKLYDVVHSHADWLPPTLGVAQPIIKAKGIDDVPILALTLWRDQTAGGGVELTQIAHTIENELKRVPGTREVSTIGASQRMVKVQLNPESLNAFQLSMQDVRAALQSANVSQNAGVLAQNNREVLVQTGGFLNSADEVKQLVIGVFNGKPVFLRDIADIQDGADQPGSYVWMGAGPAAADKDIKGKGEYTAVTVAISKKPGANAVDVANKLLARVQELKGSIIPDDVQVTTTRNYGETANDKAMKLIKKLLFATAAVVVLVWLTMGRREALVVGIAVMLTLAATLFASWAWGFTLNRVSLFALIFSIGILVDDAIVVVENIHRHRGLEPGAPLTSLIPKAVDEVGGPTILATLTVIAALLPMAFVTGLMGPYMSPIPINASMGMVISLAIAFVVTPWLALKLAPKAAGLHGASRLDARLTSGFRRVLAPFLDLRKGKRNRRFLWIGIVAAILMSMSLALLQLVILKMLPFDNKSEFQVIVDMPAGTPVEGTAAVLHAMGAYIATVPEVTDYEGYAGTASPINFNGLVRQYDLRQLPENGDLQVNLVDKHQRDRQSHEIANAVRPELEQIAAKFGAKVKVVEVPPGPPVLSPIVAEVYGPDEAGRHKVAEFVRQQFAREPGIVGIDDSIEAGAPKILVHVDQARAAALGVSQADIVSTMRMALDGEDVTMLHDGQAKYGVPVRLTLPAERQSKLDELLALKVHGANGALVPLSEVVQARQVERDLTRYHKGLLPVSYVIGDVAGKVDSPLYGMFGVRKYLAGVSLPEGGKLGEYFIRQPSDPFRAYSLKWDGEWQVTYETFRDMGIAYAVGLVLIYLLVVAQFGSYMTPLVIMAPIPLTIIGVMPGHALLHAQFTATSMIGMIALAGIIVRNSILLVDFINLQVERGIPFAEAVVNSAAARAKPIALTGLAAMLGATFILDDPIFNGLAIALIFGILVSTLLTLVVIPVLYYAVNRKRFQ